MSYLIGGEIKVKLSENYTGNFAEGYYKVTAINTIQELKRFGVSVYSLIYSQYGYTLIEFEEVNRNAIVYTLTDKDNGTVYAPADVLVPVAEETLVAYEGKAIAISLGEWPTYRNFSSLITYLEEAILEFIGVTPTVQLISTSEVFRVPEDEHLVIAGVRENKSDNVRTYSRRLVSREQELEVANVKIRAMEEFILFYLTACAANCGAGPLEEISDPYSETLIDRNHFNFKLGSENRMRARSIHRNTFK